MLGCVPGGSPTFGEVRIPLSLSYPLRPPNNKRQQKKIPCGSSYFCTSPTNTHTHTTPFLIRGGPAGNALRSPHRADQTTSIPTRNSRGHPKDALLAPLLPKASSCEAQHWSPEVVLQQAAGRHSLGLQRCRSRVHSQLLLLLRSPVPIPTAAAMGAAATRVVWLSGTPRERAGP